MVHFATALALLGAILAAIVQAGSRGWEPKHDIQPRMSLLDQSSIAGNISQQEASTSSAGKRLRKRWNTVNPDSMKTALWPDSAITYCFESDDTREKLVNAFDEAKQKWADAGLPPSFGYKEVKGSACRGANRKNLLMIKYNDKGRLSTTLALPEIDANDPKDEDPVMNLSDAEDIGMLNIAANYAHELGHAWGLLHEHQNPAFWSGLPMANTYTGEVWSPDTFNCQNLKDYEDAVESVRKSTKVAEKDKEFQIYKLCINRNSAGDWGFSAAEYLPYTNIKARVPDKDTMELGVDDVDWASIMLYPSGPVRRETWLMALMSACRFWRSPMAAKSRPMWIQARWTFRVWYQFTKLTEILYRMWYCSMTGLIRCGPLSWMYSKASLVSEEVMIRICSMAL